MVSEITSNCGLSLIYHMLQFVAMTQPEHRNFTQYRHIYSHLGKWYMEYQRLNFRASFVFIIYTHKCHPIKHPRGKISLICR
jgi:hypothetical protein